MLDRCLFTTPPVVYRRGHLVGYAHSTDLAIAHPLHVYWNDQPSTAAVLLDALTGIKPRPRSERKADAAPRTLCIRPQAVEAERKLRQDLWATVADNGLREFIYLARDKNGKSHGGMVLALTLEAARHKISESGRRILWVKPLSRPARAGRATRSLAIFTRQFSTMLGAGLPYTKILGILYKQCDDFALKRAIARILVDMKGGHTFHHSLAAQSHIFPRAYVSTVAAAEKAGVLPWALQRLADATEAEVRLRQSIWAELTYPLVVLTLAIIGLVLFMAVILPRFAIIFNDLNIDLPFATRFMIGVSDAIPLILAGLALLWPGLRLVARLPRVEEMIDAWLAWAPLVAPLYRKYHLTQMFRLLAVLSEAGIPILQQLMLAAGASGSVLMRQALLDIMIGVRNGEHLTAAFRRMQPLLGAIPVNVVATAEASGRWSQCFNFIASLYETDLKATMDASIKSLEPMMMMVVGVIVGAGVLATFIPLYMHLTSMVR